MSGPLKGIRIIECGGYLSAPSAGYILGDMGAEVIKVEDRVKGDPVRGMSTTFGGSMILPDGTNIQFETANRNKKSITLDLKTEKGKDILFRLIKVSDVFLTNFSQPAIKKLGIDYEIMKKHNPKLVYAMATGYGLKGPDTNKRAFDTIAQARSGIMTALGDPDSPPMQIGGVLFDQTTGTLLALGILAALVEREREGTGQLVETSLLGAGIHLQAYNVNMALLRGKPMPRNSRFTLKNPMAIHYECSDGNWIILSEPQSDRFWHDFCMALGIEHLEKDPKFATATDRRNNYVEIREILDKVFATKTQAEWVKILEEKGAGLAFSPVRSLTELSSDPQVMENEYIIDAEHPSLGPVNLIGYPIKFSETPAKMSSCAPMFGQHTEEVLMELLGYDWDVIGQLKEEEII